MPPKQQSKADMAKKQKVVEDKTFGLKNKNKSKNVQKYVQNLKQAVQPKPDATKVAAKVAVSQPKVPVGVDPKSILCEFFKAGQCTKGFKCKFSHDLNVQRKGEKIDIYSDKRDGEDTMEDWDQEKLEKVVESKTKEYNQNKPTEIVCSFSKLESFEHIFQMTGLVCKYFLDAVEKKQYGWFWVCPNGGKDCHYRHALPPGYVLKSQMKALLEEEAEKIPVEEEIENQRAKVTTTTPMTPELFLQWKKKKMEERDADASLFVDDAEAYEKYLREEPEVAERKAKDNTAVEGPSASSSAVAGSEEAPPDDDDDDDELDMDELNELEASLSRTSIQIREPGIEAS
ncbi:hypothetical protein FEM48_Zijuj03G0082800 [Ziziphus jujuba var. spinosa]|uniref:C3H1-type domain-containing protein n=1 Tax=Ziziphus jujuba var. spinosa TaxID=714518 RepID=A0A978VP71_ZIZJJ|nr:hypothetical protein FEM48_Zijuj03G0082800 [Ziziphus jujuba var. spinosa]